VLDASKQKKQNKHVKLQTNANLQGLRLDSGLILSGIARALCISEDGCQDRAAGQLL
jgi:hypothetical protein